MVSTYPSEKFLAEAKCAINKQKVFEIVIKKGWRVKVLKKEIETWFPNGEEIEMHSKQWRAPSLVCQLFMPSLLAVHYAAFSASYELRPSLGEDFVVLTYVPS